MAQGTRGPPEELPRAPPAVMSQALEGSPIPAASGWVPGSRTGGPTSVWGAVGSSSLQGGGGKRGSR